MPLDADHPLRHRIRIYQELSEADLAQIKRGHELANEVGRFIDELRQTPGADQRWVAIGVTQLQQGFAALIRAVVRPGTFA